MRHPYRIILIILLLVAIGIVWMNVNRIEGEQASEMPQEDSIGSTTNEDVVPEQESDEQVRPVEKPETFESLRGIKIVVTQPQVGALITSPLSLAGEAPGFWFFEASFPVVLVDWDGLIIAQGIATAQDDWMTEDYVAFTATLEFITPEYGETGTLILRRDNPSGLPENDDAVEILIRFTQ
ncbi:hypothetical protein HQ487_04750 [Candidatus Uhrbacteria bacterium]|nr:hypothetical protein [Candidatus Uhrbacteria bacterium]